EMYSGNYYGPIQYNDLQADNQRAATIRYHNVNHVGNQVFHGYQSTAVLSGNVSSVQRNPYDAGLGRGNWNINATNQANFEVGYLEVLEGAKVHLST
ncbi:pectate lyase-like adhesive domain-containing protein, partial [Enterococcus faecium]